MKLYEVNAQGYSNGIKAGINIINKFKTKKEMLEFLKLKQLTSKINNEINIVYTTKELIMGSNG